MPYENRVCHNWHTLFMYIVIDVFPQIPAHQRT